MKKKYRPPISAEREKMLEEIRAKLNEDALIPLTLHNVLDLVIDRAYMAMFPKQTKLPKRKRYIKISF